VHLITEHAAELAAIEARDTGKPKSAAAADIAALWLAISNFMVAAPTNCMAKLCRIWRAIWFRCFANRTASPGHILPWNYPAQMFGRTLAPSLAAGNAVVLKPAEDACLSSLRIAELAREAGFRTARSISSRAKVPWLVRRWPRIQGIDFLSFTGSPAVGQAVQKLAADHFIACTLELGGKSPQVVFADADLDAAMPGAAQSDYPKRRPDLLGGEPRSCGAQSLRHFNGATARFLCGRASGFA
jgi:aldehyde dehydrogenase (NAD+)